MKRRDLLIFGASATGWIVTSSVLGAGRVWAADKKWTIGFSQATTIEPWRAQFNKDLIAEAKKHPEVELIITDGRDKTEKQVADVENLIRQEVDALLISPKESAGLTGVTQQAIDAKIPVFVLDRNVNLDDYTEFVGGDNKQIGREAGKTAVQMLGGAGQAKGNIVEIWGGLGTQPAHDRHNGFHEIAGKEPGIKFLLNQQSADWKQDQAYNIMSTALLNFDSVDMVYGQNDPMAYGAYLAAQDVGRTDDIKFIGTDGLPQEGVTWVANGQLDATFVYPTPGAAGLRNAIKYLNGQKVPKHVTLPTTKVTQDNAEKILEQHGLA